MNPLQTNRHLRTALLCSAFFVALISTTSGDTIYDRMYSGPAYEHRKAEAERASTEKMVWIGAGAAVTMTAIICGTVILLKRKR